MKSKKITAYVLLLLACVFWGASYVFTKELLQNIHPVAIMFLRAIISAVFLFGICFIFLRTKLSIIKKDFKILFAFSFFEPFLYFIFETYSLVYSSASFVAIIIATIPLFTALLSKYYFKEDFTVFNMIGAAISVVGIGIMILPTLQTTANSNWGILLAFLAVAAAVAYGFFLKTLPSHYHPVVVTAYQNLIGAVLFLPLFLFYGYKNGFPTVHILLNSLNFSYLLTLAILCSSLAFIFFINGIRTVGLGRGNIFTNFIPIVTAVVSYFLLDEIFPFYKIIGIIVIVAGILMVQYKKTKHVSFN
jgi:drug/metabolite transporter (DMT)-like permease